MISIPREQRSREWCCGRIEQNGASCFDRRVHRCFVEHDWIHSIPKCASNLLAEYEVCEKELAETASSVCYFQALLLGITLAINMVCSVQAQHNNFKDLSISPCILQSIQINLFFMKLQTRQVSAMKSVFISKRKAIKNSE